MKKLLTLLALTPLLTGAALAEPLDVGAAAPKLKAVDQNSKEIDLGSVFAEGITLVYFYPKADTPGCTKQACSLRDSIDDVKSAGIRVIGVSEDKSEAQKKFEEKYNLPFTLIADTDGKVAGAFGVPVTKGFAKRQSFLVKNGKVVWRNLAASPATHTEEVIAAAKAAK